MYTSSSQSGFTLIEMLIAVLIFSLSLVALMTIASRSIQSNRAAQDEITAQFLAAEGIEAVRHIRDTNFIIAGNDWLQGIDNCIDEECRLVFNTEMSGLDTLYTLERCEGGCFPVLISQNRYGVPSGDPSSFTRIISIEQSDDANAIAVTSTVEWLQGRAERSISMESLLTNWQITQ